MVFKRLNDVILKEPKIKSLLITETELMDFNIDMTEEANFNQLKTPTQVQEFNFRLLKDLPPLHA